MASDLDKNLEKLKQACDKAYMAYPRSCSHAVWHVISQYEPSHPYMQANQLINHLIASPKWQLVELYELSKLASQGTLVVGGRKETPGNGHVIVVYPGPEKLSGGYYFKRSDGRTVKAVSDGSYARALSTTMGNWPGARSCGDKTVRDP